MNKIFVSLLLLFTTAVVAQTRMDSAIVKNSISVGKTTAADSKSIADFTSTTKGVLPPRLTTTQRDNISSPTEGLWLYNDTTNLLNFYNGSGWLQNATLTGTETLTNKTLSGNTAVNLISGSGTLTLNTSGTVTLPNATDTLVGKATTDTLTNKTIDADGTGNSISNIENADIKAAAAIAVNKLAAVTASRALVSDGSGFVSPATTTSTEIGYVNGVTSAIQTQLDAKVAKSTLTTKGDIYIATGASTVVRQAVGADGTFLKADSAQTNGVTWATAGSSKSVVSKAFADTPFTASTEDIILYDTSGGASTINLPAGSAGKVFRITKTTTDFSVLTVDGDASENIRDNGTSATTTTLNTAGESIELVWNGTLWEVTDRRIPSGWTAYTPTGSVTTNATYTGVYRRSGDSIELQITAVFGSTNTQGDWTFTAAQAMNGLTGLTIDEDRLSSASASNDVATVGVAVYEDSGAAHRGGMTVWYQKSTDLIKTAGSSFSDITPASNTPITIASGDSFSFKFTLPITGWKK